jgi:DNA-binding XRE family transcriptional regulator
MRITPDLTDTAVLQALGSRLERQRIEANLTQAALADQAGISKRTLERVEAGHGCELVTLVRLLRVLGLTEGFENLIPELPPSPLAQLKLQGQARKRVHAKAKAARVDAPPVALKPWKWGE